MNKQIIVYHNKGERTCLYIGILNGLGLSPEASILSSVALH